MRSYVICFTAKFEFVSFNIYDMSDMFLGRLIVKYCFFLWYIWRSPREGTIVSLWVLRSVSLAFEAFERLM